MQLVTFTLPTAAGAMYTFSKEAQDLWAIRARLDAFVLVRPLVVGTFTQIVDTIKYRRCESLHPRFPPALPTVFPTLPVSPVPPMPWYSDPLEACDTPNTPDTACTAYTCTLCIPYTPLAHPI